MHVFGRKFSREPQWCWMDGRLAPIQPSIGMPTCQPNTSVSQPSQRGLGRWGGALSDPGGWADIPCVPTDSPSPRFTTGLCKYSVQLQVTSQRRGRKGFRYIHSHSTLGLTTFVHSDPEACLRVLRFSAYDRRHSTPSLTSTAALPPQQNSLAGCLLPLLSSISCGPVQVQRSKLWSPCRAAFCTQLLPHPNIQNFLSLSDLQQPPTLSPHSSLSLTNIH